MTWSTGFLLGFTVTAMLALGALFAFWLYLNWERLQGDLRNEGDHAPCGALGLAHLPECKVGNQGGDEQ